MHAGSTCEPRRGCHAIASTALRRPALRCAALPQVVVAEAGPGYDGHAMASQLSQAKVQTTLIADSAVFAMMARVNKVRGVWPWGGVWWSGVAPAYCAKRPPTPVNAYADATSWHGTARP